MLKLIGFFSVKNRRISELQMGPYFDRQMSSYSLRLALVTCWVFIGILPFSSMALPAFPGAEGWGRDTVGGRGGRVLHVTSLADSGPGTLRWALEDQSGPRIVVFSREGHIRLSTQIRIRNPFVTLAGQSAPGQGIVVSGARINIETSEVIIRGMKLRVGDRPGGDTPSNRDNISVGRINVPVRRVIVDSNSLTWSVDESACIWGDVRDITFSNNIIAESLRDSIHIDEGASLPRAHSMGFLIGHRADSPKPRRVSIIKNLFASNQFRNAAMNGVDIIEFINNFIFNYGAGHQGAQIGQVSTIAFIGNYYRDGLDTGSGGGNPPVDMRNTVDGSRVFLRDNFATNHRESARQPESAIAHGRLHLITNSLNFVSNRVRILSSTHVPASVLRNAGPRRLNGFLDPVDTRILAQVEQGTSRIIDRTNQVGGYGVYQFTGEREVDTDGDGMPDWWEIRNARFGFDYLRADGHLDYDNDGYTNVEEYLNGRISGYRLNGL